MSRLPPKLIFRRAAVLLVLFVILTSAICGFLYVLTNPKNYSENFDSLNSIKFTSDYKVDCSQTQSAVIGTAELGIISKCGRADEKLPTASIAKTITALVTLESKLDQLDKEITLDQHDVDLYTETAWVGGSHIMVWEGEILTLRQMVTGMMLASANNLADSIAYHEYGGQDGYKAAAADFLVKHNLRGIDIGADASGLDEGTVATATDLFQIGVLAHENDILREIVASESVDFPPVFDGYGPEVVFNIINDFHEAGYTGIKTGNTDLAGFCMLWSKPVDTSSALFLDSSDDSRYSPGGKAYTAIGVSQHNAELVRHEEVYNIETQFENNFVNALQNPTIKLGTKIGEIEYKSTLKNYKYDVILDSDLDLPIIGNYAPTFKIQASSESENTFEVQAFINDKLAQTVKAHAKIDVKPTSFFGKNF